MKDIMKDKIYIATPMFGGMCHGEYTMALTKLLKELDANGIDHYHNFLYNESLIPRARNILTHDFLLSDCSHLFFIDADVVVRPKDVVRMFKENKEFIGGCYPKKMIDWDRVTNALNHGVPRYLLPYACSEYVFNVFDGEDPSFKSDELMKVKNMGTGYMMIKRSVFEKLKSTTPSYIDNSSFKGQCLNQYFAISMDGTNELSEDYHFCKTWNDIGGELYIAPYAKAQHIGTYRFG